MLLSDLPDGARAFVEGLVEPSPAVSAQTLRRLAELGFITGEPVQVLRRGPGGMEPIAVMVGDTMFGLRLFEARSVRVRLA